MKVLTLHQPWASLIALGVKSIETRSWRAPESLIGQRFAIHAAATRPTLGRVGSWDIDPRRAGDPAMRDVHGDGSWVPLPLGCIVATAVLDDCVPMVESLGAPDDPMPRVCLTERGVKLMRPFVYPSEDVTDQLPYGDFRPGRWAWILRDAEPITETCPACWGTDNPFCLRCNGDGRCDPIPFKGGQGLSREWTP